MNAILTREEYGVLCKANYGFLHEWEIDLCYEMYIPLITGDKEGLDKAMTKSFYNYSLFIFSRFN